MTNLPDLKPAQRRMADLMPAETAQKEISFALQLIAGSSQLQQCTALSLQSAVVNVANIGLSLNPAAKEAYLVPRYNSQKKELEATLQPSYVGLVKLLTDAGAVKSINTQVVYEGDNFEMDLANGTIRHIPALSKSKRGELLGAYAIAILHTGHRQIEWMDTEEINEVRAVSESWKNEKTRPYSPWEKHYPEMVRKTVIRRLYKYLPRTPQMERVDNAVQLDDTQYKATFNQVMLIDDLLRATTISPEKARLIESKMHKYSQTEASEAINYLREHQEEPIDPGKQFLNRAKNG